MQKGDSGFPGIALFLFPQNRLCSCSRRFFEKPADERTQAAAQQCGDSVHDHIVATAAHDSGDNKRKYVTADGAGKQVPGHAEAVLFEHIAQIATACTKYCVEEIGKD